VAGALAYVTFIPAIIFLVMEPYSKNKFIRFHSFQSLFLRLACFVLAVVLMFIPLLGPILGLLLWLGEFVLGLVLVLKAYQGRNSSSPVSAISLNSKLTLSGRKKSPQFRMHSWCTFLGPAAWRLRAALPCARIIPHSGTDSCPSPSELDKALPGVSFYLLSSFRPRRWF